MIGRIVDALAAYLVVGVAIILHAAQTAGEWVIERMRR